MKIYCLSFSPIGSNTMYLEKVSFDEAIIQDAAKDLEDQGHKTQIRSSSFNEKEDGILVIRWRGAKRYSLNLIGSRTELKAQRSRLKRWEGKLYEEVVIASPEQLE